MLTMPERIAAGKAAHMGLGDMTAASLAAIGVTKELVEKLLGRPCNCPARQEWLNRVGRLFGVGASE